MTDGAVQVFVSVGSNIDPVENLQLACRALAARYQEVEFSTVYRNPAVGFSGADFLNLVIALRTAEPATLVRDFLEELHVQAKRVRLPERFSPRSLDLDLLLYGDVVDPALQLPHGDIEKYPFVLGPLAELAPRLRHPVTGATIADMWAAMEATEPNQSQPMEAVSIELL